MKISGRTLLSRRASSTQPWPLERRIQNVMLSSDGYNRLLIACKPGDSVAAHSQTLGKWFEDNETLPGTV
jgi:hypothetical protein